MLNSHFATEAWDTEYPSSSHATLLDNRLKTPCALNLDLSAANDPAGGGKLRCEPDVDQRRHVFHWLVFAAESPDGKDPFSAGCDLWRWHEVEWRSVFVAGAIFSPEEMHTQGWRYCAPSAQLFVNICSDPKKHQGEPGRAEARPRPVVSASAVVASMRNRLPATARPSPLPAWQRPAGAWRRGPIGSV
jgi:hypothetical protein